MGKITAHGLRHGAATILLNHMGKDLREIQEILRDKISELPCVMTHVGYEQTRQIAEAHARSLDWIFPMLGEVGTTEDILALLS